MDGRQDVGHARRLRAGPQGLAAWTEPRASPRPVIPAAALDMSSGCSQVGGAPLHQGPPRRRTEGAPCPLARTRAGQTGPAAAASGSWPRPASLSPAHGGERVPTRTGFHAAPRHGTPTRGRRRGLGLVGGRADPKPHGALSRQTPRGRERLQKAGPGCTCSAPQRPPTSSRLRSKLLVG